MKSLDLDRYKKMAFFKSWKQIKKPPKQKNPKDPSPQLSGVPEIFRAIPDLLHYTLDFNLPILVLSFQHL